MKFVLFPLIVLLVLASRNQNRVEIIHADANSGRTVNGEQLRILSGDVHIRKDSTELFCNEAVFYSKQDYIHLDGGVRLIRGSQKLRSAYLNYYPSQDKAIAYGGVILTDVKDSLNARRLVYDMKTDTVWADEKITYINEPKHLTLLGDRAFYNRPGSFLHVWGNNHFSKTDSISGDTLHIRARHFYYFKNPQRILFARDCVRVRQGTFRARADSMRYLPDSENVYLMGRPRVNVDRNILSGVAIRALLDSGAVKQVFVTGKALALSPRDSLSELKNRLSGKEMELYLENKKPVLIIARSNAGSLYYVENESEPGVNWATADSIYVYFKEGRADSIVVNGGVQGTYYPDSYKGERKY